jgi:hypothetical protein
MGEFISGPPADSPEVTAAKQQRLQEDAARLAAAAEAAAKINGPIPGIEQRPQVETPAPNGNNLGGRSGLGVIETKMPADPSHIVGWEGQVRR